MHRSIVYLVLALLPLLAQGEGIVDVLERSQAMRLQLLSEPTHGLPSAAAVQRIGQSFGAVLASSGVEGPVSLRVVRGDVLAETLQGRVIVVDESLAELNEGERVFVLAHELGHVALAHWSQMQRLYQSILPGEVTRSASDAAAGLLGREASALAHRQEYAADVYALGLLRQLGYGEADVAQLFVRLGPRGDTPTHPSSTRRLARLRGSAYQH